jgi:hypothetical protein
MPVTTTRRGAGAARTAQACVRGRADEPPDQLVDHAVRPHVAPRVLGQRDAEGVLDRHPPLDGGQAVDAEVVAQQGIHAQLGRADRQLLGRQLQQPCGQVGGRRHGTGA